MNKSLPKTGLMMLALVGIVACDLEIEETDFVSTEASDGGFEGVANVATSVDNLFNALSGHLGDQANFFALFEVTTDEQLVPTRGTDWGDNGIWRTLHAHTWNASHTYVLNVWNQMNQNSFQASEVIDDRSTTGRTAELVAQARFIRAFSNWAIMDLYGVLPVRGVDDGPEVLPTVLSRTEALALVISDLESAIADLPNNGPGVDNNRATQASARLLLARVLLNAHIYDGSGTPSDANLQQVVSLVDAIEAAGYTFEENYFDIFNASTDNETIWFAETSPANRIFNGTHYNMPTPDNGGGGWNGFSTLAEFYDLFEGDPNSNRATSVDLSEFVPADGQEIRRGFTPDENTTNEDNLGYGLGFQIGQIYSATGFDDDGNPEGFAATTERPGAPLVFTREFAPTGLNGNTESNGIRLLKYHPSIAGDGAFRNHEIVFRWSDASLMRAEANFRLGNSADALTEINTLREIRGAQAFSALTEQDILDERGRELYVEFIRRVDLIRFGQYTRDWEAKDPASVGAEFRSIFPIPVSALLSNPNLVQNEGY